MVTSGTSTSYGERVSFISSRRPPIECYHRIYCCTLSRRLLVSVLIPPVGQCQGTSERGLSSMTSFFRVSLPVDHFSVEQTRGRQQEGGVGCHAMYGCFCNVNQHTWPAVILLVGKVPIVCVEEVRLRGLSSIARAVRISRSHDRSFSSQGCMIFWPGPWV